MLFSNNRIEKCTDANLPKARKDSVRFFRRLQMEMEVGHTLADDLMSDLQPIASTRFEK